MNESQSVLDKLILSNFNTHLELTLISNPHLLSKYPHYKALMSDFMTKVGLSPFDLNVPLTYQHDLTLRYSSGDPSHEAELHSCHRLLDFLSREISQETTESSLISKFSPKPLLYRKQLAALAKPQHRAESLCLAKREQKAMDKQRHEQPDPELAPLLRGVSALADRVEGDLLRRAEQQRDEPKRAALPKKRIRRTGREKKGGRTLVVGCKTTGSRKSKRNRR